MEHIQIMPLFLLEMFIKYTNLGLVNGYGTNVLHF